MDLKLFRSISVFDGKEISLEIDMKYLDEWVLT
jgi:hypothetical protein